MIFYLIFYFFVTSCLCLTDKNTNSPAWKSVFRPAVWKSEASLLKMLKYLQEEERAITSASSVLLPLLWQRRADISAGRFRSLISSSFMGEQSDRTTTSTSGCCWKYSVKRFKFNVVTFPRALSRGLHCYSALLCDSFLNNKIKYTYIYIFLAQSFFLLSFLSQRWIIYTEAEWGSTCIQFAAVAEPHRPGAGGEGGGGRGYERVSKWAENAAFSKGHHHPQALFPVFSSEAQDSRSLRMCATYRSLVE